MKTTKYLFLLFVLFAMSCAPTIFVDYKDKAFSFGQFQDQSTVKLNVMQNINVSEFRYAYRDEFGNDGNFISYLQKCITVRFDSLLHCHVVFIDTVQAIQYASPLIKTISVDLPDAKETAANIQVDESKVRKIKDYLKSIKEDYYFVITKVNISNSVSFNGGGAPVFVASAGGRGGSFVGGGGGGSSESCVIKLEAELWNVKEQKLMVSYSSVGDATVFLFFNRTALKAAIDDAAFKLIAYLKTGSLRPSIYGVAVDYRATSS